tara:strand:- start:162 stop:410 length:249 start_codon:yes stop_codon:yes gene_type:complete
MSVEYLGKYGRNEPLNKPSAVIRRIKDIENDIYTIEICNEGIPWRADMDLIKYFWGGGETVFPISSKRANKVVDSWQEKWFG